MHDFDSFSEEMKRQAQATLKAREPDLANAVLEQTLAEADAHPEHMPLKALAARIGAGVIAEFLSAGRLDGAESAWKRLHDAIILPGLALSPETRRHQGQCAYNILMGRIATGRMRKAHEVFLTLMGLADMAEPMPETDTLLAGASLRLVAVGLQLHPPQEVYDTYLPLRAAHQRQEHSLDIARSRAKACLLLCVAFAHGGDPNFARSLAEEARTVIAIAPDDPTLADVAAKLVRVYS